MEDVENQVQVEFLYLPVISYAMQQNKVSLIRLFTIENRGEEALSEVKVIVSCEPEFAVVCSQGVDIIPAKGKVKVDRLVLQLQTQFFAQLTERMAGSLTVEINAEESTLYKKSYPIDILTFDQWGGVTVLPEMLSSFVTPNHPAIAPLLKRASEIMGYWTGNPALDEYQSRNPDRVRKQMAAIYSAIYEQGVAYCTAPASFEEYGQRIRLVDSVVSQKLGNCLDMTLLYASCLEAAGIHPLVIVISGHAFAGGWLIAETFPDSVVDDMSLINKRSADGINEIVLVEATCMNQGSNTDFDRAVRAAESKLIDISRFILALDVKRARFAGIRPLPQRVLNGEQWELQSDDFSLAEDALAKPASVNPYDLSGIDSEIEVTKQLLWERKLLDLSLRNNLLNIRFTKNTLQLIAAELGFFEDMLAHGDEFRILPKPADWDNPLYDFGLYRFETSDPVLDLVKSEITQKRLRSYLKEVDLAKALQHLYRTSRLSIEENGANTLYLALGLLKWFETPSSERPRYAPILLLPIEIVRKSAATGFVIRSREEETMMNITLLEMLRQNFGITIPGLDPLPMDESGLDVKRIFSIVRNGIKNKARWDVDEQAVLGIFSFNKFIMWNDIHNNADKLKQNKVVASLVSGRLEWPVTEMTTDAAELDHRYSPAEIVLPISADSSQLEAIYEAISDKTFVLHGPPGTGKSQTITNIIANALYRGKRVLFVAEKMAALSVVQNRLQAIGLTPFCLEIHSNKVKKSAVIAQLKVTTETVRRSSPENFTQEAARLQALIEELNLYVEALHKPYHFGLSLYDVITNYLSIDVDEQFTTPAVLIETLDKETIHDWSDAIEDLVSVGNAFGHPYRHPLTGINISDYSAHVKEQSVEAISRCIESLAAVSASLDNFLSLTEGTATCHNRQQTSHIAAILKIILRTPGLSPALLRQGRVNETIDDMRNAIKHGRERDRYRKEIPEKYVDSILAIEARQLDAQWKRYANLWFLPRFIGHNKIRKQLIVHTRDGILKLPEIAGLLGTIIRFQEEEKMVSGYLAQLADLYEKFGKKEDWDRIEQITDDFEAFNAHVLALTGGIAAATKVKTVLAAQLTDGVEAFRSMYGRQLASLDKLIDRLTKDEKRLYDVLGITEATLYGQETDGESERQPFSRIAEASTGRQEADGASNKHSFSRITEASNSGQRRLEEASGVLKQWLANMDNLKDWYQWLLVTRRLDALNIGFVAEAYRSKNIPTAQILNSFLKSFCRACTLYIIANDPKLELFNGKLFEEVIRKYKELSAKFQELTKQELYARLASNIPSFTIEAAQTSEVGILQRYIKNNGRAVSIRMLFDRIPNLLPRLCPCMLMSPMSVAQFIDPDADKFDLIVFDEASQMPTYEAVGAIARGKNVVVVGDPKQMPPTNFFSVNTVDEDNIEIEDMESILDDCLALSMPSKYLLWHYRSKHESLIAFSNSEYYGNQLLTFPSHDNIESKVSLVRVEGFYDKGKSRQNKWEAQAVVTEIARRLEDESLRKRSIGVVTFSAVQQTLVEDLLSDLFVRRPDLETIALEGEEPIFIKNLENVQGDERDVILFSVGYGPDADGKVSMNFGPLNRVGGERRLNVAVSRARYEMVIYSTLRSDQIDLNRSSATGVAGLKRFLEYAEKSEIPATARSSGSTENSLADVIARALTARGYQTHTHIGCSGYRIDVGIVDKQRPSNYILGILCDGKNYRQTKTARDREIVQNGVLGSLGWRLLRVWTMDWWERPQQVLAAIEKAVKDAEQGKEEEVIPVSETGNAVYVQSAGGAAPPFGMPGQPAGGVAPPFGRPGQPAWSGAPPFGRPGQPAWSGAATFGRPGQPAGTVKTPLGRPAEPLASKSQEYKQATMPLGKYPTDEFLLPKHERFIMKQITEVVNQEAPISRLLVCKRILSAWGIARLGPRLDAYLETLFNRTPFHKAIHEGVTFFWKDSAQMENYAVYRINSGRDATDLPPEEVANAVKQTLEEQISLPTSDLARLVAQLLGYARMGTNVEAAMNQGIKVAAAKGAVKVENGRAKIV